MNVDAILDKKWYGGLYHLHNTEDSWDQWLNEFCDSYDYPKESEEKLIKIFSNNVQHIAEKNVIDLACNLGYFVLAASNLGANRSIGLEIRDEYIKTFNKIAAYWPTKNVELKKSNIECLSDLSVYLNDIDTIIYSGHFYHTNQNEALLKVFTDSSAKCLILESVVPHNPSKDGYQHATESSVDPLNGFVDDSTINIKIKKPTLEKSMSLLEELGWTITSYSITEHWNPSRYIITAIKENKHVTI